MIKALETNYKGYRFRSRLEARWAVYFDTMDIRWEYETQGFLLPSGPYLPDFFLPDHELWFEVKGKDADTEERQRCRELSYGDHCVLLSEGNIDSSINRITLFCFDTGSGGGESEWMVAMNPDIEGVPTLFMFDCGNDCRYSDEITLVDSRWNKLKVSFWTDFLRPCDARIIDKAELAARSARFEHNR